PSKRDCASPDLDHVAADADAALFIHFQIEQRRPPRLLSLLDLEPAGKLAPQGKTPAAEICGRRAGRRVFEDGRSLRKEESREQPLLPMRCPRRLRPARRPARRYVLCE